MTALTIRPFSFLTWLRAPRLLRERTEVSETGERQRIISHMIAVGACDSEYCIEMLMSVYPDRF